MIEELRIRFLTEKLWKPFRLGTYLPQIMLVSKSKVQPDRQGAFRGVVSSVYFPLFFARRRLNTASAELSRGGVSFIPGVEGEFVLGATTLLPVC